MNHRIVMIPPAFGRMSSKFWPEGAKILGATTEAALIGTIWKNTFTDDIVTMKGLLAEDLTFVIEDCQIQLLDRILSTLKVGKVHKVLPYGILEYPVKAKLVFICRPFKPSEELKSVFEIVEWEGIQNETNNDI